MTHASGNQSNSEIVRPKLLQILIKSTNQNNSEIRTTFQSVCAVEGTMKAQKDIIIFGIPSVITTNQLN